MKRVLIIALVLLLSDFFTQVSFAQEQREVIPMMGAYKSQTVKITSTDTATTLESLYNTGSGITAISFTTAKIKAAFITCETADVRFAFGSTPTQAGLGHILPSGQSMRIASPSLLQKLKIISKTGATPASLQVTLEY